LHFKIVIKPKKTKKREIRRYKMNTLNLGSDEIPATKKKSNTRNLKIALGLAAVILVPTIGSTLAGGIAVNSNTAVEFGQGVVATTACSPTITLTPTSALVSSAFVLDTIAVSGINANCDEKYLTIKVLDSNGDAVAIGTAGALFCRINIEITGAGSPLVFTHGVGDTCGTLSGQTAAGFTLTPTTKPASDDVTKITIESGSVA